MRYDRRREASGEARALGARSEDSAPLIRWVFRPNPAPYGRANSVRTARNASLTRISTTAV
jgi:hypothetical protein